MACTAIYCMWTRACAYLHIHFLPVWCFAFRRCARFYYLIPAQEIMFDLVSACRYRHVYVPAFMARCGPTIHGHCCIARCVHLRHTTKVLFVNFRPSSQSYFARSHKTQPFLLKTTSAFPTGMALGLCWDLSTCWLKRNIPTMLLQLSVYLITLTKT